jgi:hypothetical protein
MKKPRWVCRPSHEETYDVVEATTGVLLGYVVQRVPAPGLGPDRGAVWDAHALSEAQVEYGAAAIDARYLGPAEDRDTAARHVWEGGQGRCRTEAVTVALRDADPGRAGVALAAAGVLAGLTVDLAALTASRPERLTSAVGGGICVLSVATVLLLWYARRRRVKARLVLAGLLPPARRSRWAGPRGLCAAARRCRGHHG